MFPNQLSVQYMVAVMDSTIRPGECRSQSVASNKSLLFGQNGRCFLAAWAVSASFRNVRQKPNLLIWKDNPSSRRSARVYYSANALFEGGGCAPIGAHRQHVPKASSLAAEHRKPHCKQDGCTLWSRWQCEALVILLQKTHCSCAVELTIPSRPCQFNDVKEH